MQYFRHIFLLSLFATDSLLAQTINITGPVGSGQFGKFTEVLANGNYVVTDPGYDEGGLTDIGAVYLYNGVNNAIISTLKGSSNGDQVGSEGVKALPNGNFVVQSQYWDNGPVTDAGAVTWCNGTTGLNAVVSSANSLVGSTANDKIGYYFGLQVLVVGNSNYIVRSTNWDNGAATDAGAVTWGDGNSGVSGIITSANSLVGSTTNDQVGYYGVVLLTNGNYVITNPAWDNGPVVNAGAVTWGNGNTGISGVISSANSLVGSTVNDNVGNIESSTRILPLTNGNYVVFSPDWDNGGTSNVGAVTWCNGTTGLTGTVSTANSLTGSNSNDRVGYAQGLALTNGHYVVCSRQWRNGSFFNAGAVTWCNGTSGLTGTVNTGNSLVGTKTNDFVGFYASPLTNGNYVVQSTNWSDGVNGATGASTWCNGTAVTAAVVSVANSLVGSSPGDLVGNYITALSNGNYVISSQYWNNGAITDAGAATWGNGSSGTTGVVSMANSIVGSTAFDEVGYFGITALTNGNYVIKSPYWDNGAMADAGAATWGDGNTGTSGIISAANSLVGDKANDLVSRNGINALSNGNYCVSSGYWDNGAATDAGAITLGNGTSGTTGIVSAANSVVSLYANDMLGNGGTVTFAGGGFTVSASTWNNGTAADAGASMYNDGLTPIAGVLNADNSLVGSLANDRVGQGALKLSNDVHAVVNSYQSWGSGTGSITWVNSNTGLRGYINGCNSVFSNVPGSNFFTTKFNAVHNSLLVGKPLENAITVFKPSNPSINNHLDVVAYNINATTPIDFINNSCRMIATMQPTGGATAIAGLTAARSWLDATQNREYVKRHYEIAPATNINTATGRVTLYFTDADFNAFNTQIPAPYTMLPLSTDGPALIAIRKQNLLIERRRGYSNNLATGAPATYTSGVYQTINPNDVDINYNSTLSRWEVTFDVTGFGGFFVKTVPWVLPVQWLHVTAKLNNQKQTVVNWQVEEQATKTYTVEKSMDGINFSLLAALNSRGDGKNNYSYTDTDHAQQKTYYRIVQTDNSDKKSYSNIVYVDPKYAAAISLYPNPVSDWVTINSYNNQLLNTAVRIFSSEGKLVKNVLLKTTVQKINVKELAAGLYLVSFADGSTSKMLKR